MLSVLLPRLGYFNSGNSFFTEEILFGEGVIDKGLDGIAYCL
jgi:hypothetical protein